MGWDPPTCGNERGHNSSTDVSLLHCMVLGAKAPDAGLRIATVWGPRGFESHGRFAQGAHTYITGEYTDDVVCTHKSISHKFGRKSSCIARMLGTPSEVIYIFDIPATNGCTMHGNTSLVMFVRCVTRRIARWHTGGLLYTELRGITALAMHMRLERRGARTAHGDAMNTNTPQYETTSRLAGIDD